MIDTRYEYTKVNALKIIVVNSEGKVLLIKEPETNEWMPGHWGLPGGKTLVKESLYEAFKRKMKGDLNIDGEPLGLYAVEELLMEGKTALMFHTVTRIEGTFEFKGEIAGYKWVSKEDVEKMETEEFTEFFNKTLLTEFLNNSGKIIPFDFIRTQAYYKLSNDRDYNRWKNSGTK